MRVCRTSSARPPRGTAQRAFTHTAAACAAPSMLGGRRRHAGTWTAVRTSRSAASPSSPPPFRCSTCLAPPAAQRCAPCRIHGALLAPTLSRRPPALTEAANAARSTDTEAPARGAARTLSSRLPVPPRPSSASTVRRRFLPCVVASLQLQGPKTVPDADKLSSGYLINLIDSPGHVDFCSEVRPGPPHLLAAARCGPCVGRHALERVAAGCALRLRACQQQRQRGARRMWGDMMWRGATAGCAMRPPRLPAAVAAARCGLRWRSCQHLRQQQLTLWHRLVPCCAHPLAVLCCAPVLGPDGCGAGAFRRA